MSFPARLTNNDTPHKRSYLRNFRLKDLQNNTGLAVAADYETGQKMIKNRSFEVIKQFVL